MAPWSRGFVELRAALWIARQSNDHPAEVVRARPDRFAAFATTPLQHPAEGADELQRAVEQLGLVGTMLFGQTGGRYLDDRSFDPLWERAGRWAPSLAYTLRMRVLTVLTETYSSPAISGVVRLVGR